MHNTETPLVGIIGAPNSGKTTLFNWLTGSKYRAVNYPGSTVDYYLGSTLKIYGSDIGLMDTPGTYSLFPQSPDEEVTWKALFEPKNDHQVKKLIVVVDSTQMSRHLYLVKQAIDSGFQVVVALTMSDLIRKEKMQLSAERLSKALKCPVIEIDGTLGGGVKELVQALAALPASTQNPKALVQWDQNKIVHVMKDVEFLTKEAFIKNKTKLDVYTRANKIDRVLLHPVFGYLIFAAIMTAIFSSIFWIAAPFMDYVDGGFSFLGEAVVTTFGENLFSDLISNGIIASFAAVFVFVPQIFILFLGVGFLEDSGYLARASTLIDKPFSKMGMNGRSFVPILSGFACAVPAMMASRTLGSKRERYITMFIIPLMTCSARLPVFALLLTFLFWNEAAWKAGLALTGLYFGALVVGAISAAILNKILSKNEKSIFMMELPIYRTPHVRVLLKNAFDRTFAYARRAGPIIFVLALIIWTASTFPDYKNPDQHQKLEASYAGQMGKVIEPVFEPMGVDWRAGVGLISAFAAREVFVSSLAVMFNVAETDDEDTMQTSLMEQMKTATNSEGALIFTPATVLGLIVFFMIALQCISTVGIAAKEMNSYGFAIMQLVVFNVVAYALAVGLVQGLRAIGIN
ncbi:MAG: ferrous iron transporter B [Bdellovibrionota bacterium]